MKIFRLIFILALGLQIGFGADENGSSGSGQNVGNANDDYKYYLKYQSKSIVNEGECQKCDDVKDGFIAIQYHYDDMTGTTYCNVFKETDLNTPVGFAHRQVKSCAFINSEKLKNAEKEAKQIIENSKSNTTIKSSIGSKSNNANSNEITFSQFIAGLVTLDPNIISRQNSATGEIVLNKKLKSNSYGSLTNDADFIANKILSSKNATLDGVSPDGLSDRAKLYFIDKRGIALNTENISAIDAFNKNNMGYFNDLFIGLGKIYQHLQIFIFILIGGFFVMQIGASKLQAYLENRGESEGKQPYLHKFYIPLLMIGIFFMPIPEGNGYHSTVMQNMIRYFAQYSTTLADMAHSAGAKIYIEKIYKAMGRVGVDGITELKITASKKHSEALSMHKTLNGCGCCFETNFVAGTTALGNHNICENKDKKKFVNCNYCENNLSQLTYVAKEWEQLDEQYSKTLNYQKKYSAALNGMDKYFALRSDELGWIDALLTPTSGILIETKLLSRAAKDNVKDRETRIKEVGDLTKLASTIRMSKAQGISKDEAEETINDTITESVIGSLGGNLVWMMFPGATAIKDFLKGSDKNNKDKEDKEDIKILKMFKKYLTPFITKVFGEALSVGRTIAAYAGAIVLMKWTFAMIPLLAISVASLVAFLSYLVSLCKYFYISPFVTAWAMATKKTDKIIDFLLAGIAIFFKPILIVLFIYLSLFLYVFVDEFFIFIATEQFSGIAIPPSEVGFVDRWIENVSNPNNGFLRLYTGTYDAIVGTTAEMANDFHINFIIGAIGGLLKIFGGLASSYVAWKLIVSGPGWALGLVGLDGKQDDMVASGIESNLARRAFVA